MEPPHFTDLVLAAQCGEERRGGPTGETTTAVALQEVSVGEGQKWWPCRGDNGVWRSEGSDVMFKEAERKGEGK